MRTCPRIGRPILLLFVALTLVGVPAFAKVETWRHDSASAFEKGKTEHVVISDAGILRLARSVEPTAALDASHVWALARTKDGTLFAATGDAGKVFRREADKPWEVAVDVEDTQVLSVVAASDGRVFAGTGPSGQVVEISDPKHPASRPGPDVKYIWDLAVSPDGTLFAATGPNGQLWKRSKGDEASWTLVLDSPHPHLLCVAAAPDGSVFAGSDGEGLIYRVGPDGKVSVLYDAPQHEIHTLRIGPDGALYAGTADGSSSDRGSSRSSSNRTTENAPDPHRDTRVFTVARRVSAQQPPSQRPGPSSDTPGGTARPRSGPSGENVVYRIGADGAAREIFRARALIFALAWQGDRLLIGTGPEGRLFEVRDLGRESAPIARLDHGQILALLQDASGNVLLGAGDPGAVLRLSPRYADAGTLTSDVLDTKLISRFGALTWRAECPKGTTLALQVRTGNVGEPDETWSDWSPPQTDPASAIARVPNGRFAQYRARLSTDDPSKTPELKAVSLRYQTVNLPPEIGKITVPDLSEADGATRRTRLDLKWDASDPNDDDLSYTLAIRKEGWPDWVAINNGKPLTEKAYAWDTTAVPAGLYQVRVQATDRPSNPPDEALTRTLTSEPFLVDHLAPTVTVSQAGDTIKATLNDDLTRLVKAAYALDGGDWVPVFPDDGLFDTRKESLTIRLPNLKSGTHVLMIRTTDAAGNDATGDLVFQTP